MYTVIIASYKLKYILFGIYEYFSVHGRTVLSMQLSVMLSLNLLGRLCETRGAFFSSEQGTSG